MMLSRMRSIFFADASPSPTPASLPATLHTSHPNLHSAPPQRSPLALRPSVTQSSTPRLTPSTTSKICFCRYREFLKGCVGSGARRRPELAAREACRVCEAVARGVACGEGKIFVEPCVVMVRRVRGSRFKCRERESGGRRPPP